jgi:8-oxo-dGTP diphosphatase
MGMENRFKLVPAVAVMLKRGSEILLARRSGTGWYDGSYAFVGGGVDGKETIVQAAAREVLEEVGVVVKTKDLKVVHVQHYYNTLDKQESLVFFLETSIWEGDPKIMEPDKCSELNWFELCKLPEDLLPNATVTLQKLKEGVFYSEVGWNN